MEAGRRLVPAHGALTIKSRPPPPPTPSGTPPWHRREASPLPLFCAAQKVHFVALRNFGAVERARSSTLMRESEAKNAFSAFAKIEPAA